jgi:branched-chain amino acid transport system ATP-binding protein
VVVLMLEVAGVTKQIGGLTAVNRVDLSVAEGEIVGLVGPNGAGKTTLLNLISGISRPDEGTIRFMNEEITGLAPEQICRKGISKTFQIAQSFPGLPAQEAVMVGSLFGNHGRPSVREAREEARELLRFVGFADEKQTQLVRNLNVVELKRLQLARALATHPKLLLLDELTTGLSPQESQEAIELIKKIRERGTSILLIEHVMRVIMGLSDRVVVLDRGERIAHGPPHEVVANRRVIETYLGEACAF